MILDFSSLMLLQTHKQSKIQMDTDVFERIVFYSYVISVRVVVHDFNKELNERTKNMTHSSQGGDDLQNELKPSLCTGDANLIWDT
jgi:hypothetical protein